VEETAERTWAAVERAKAELRVAEDLRDSQLLRELAARLVTEESAPALYDEILAAAIALTQADAGCVHIYDQALQELELLASQGFGAEIVTHLQRTIATPNTPAGLALATNRRIVVEFDRLPKDADDSLCMQRDAGYVSSQSTPLVARSGKSIGMVTTHWRSRYRLRERQLRYLDLLARQAADLLERRQAQAAQRQELEAKVAERTRELADANRSLREQIAERHRVEQTRNRLLRQLVTAEEDERRRLSRELHDEVGQLMTALGLQIAAVRRFDLRPEAESHIERVQQILTQAENALDFLVWALRPTALDDLGLADALQEYVRNWSDYTGVQAELHVRGGHGSRLPREVDTVLYRIAQEALNNVAKHAHARGVNLIVERREHELTMIIEDDGDGFDPEEIRRTGAGFGLQGMRERAALLGGSVEVESAPAKGTTVFVRVRF
jgi:signal transduction histidine kinase